MKRLWILLLTAALLGSGGLAITPGEAIPGGVTIAAAQEAAAQPAPAALDPSTRRAYRHVFIAFGVAWALMLGYVIMLDRRYAVVERALERERVDGR